MLTKDGILKYLRYGGLSLTVLDECISTNIIAKEAITSDKREALIISRKQSGGKGRMGRSFYSPHGGLYMSLLLYPKLQADRALHVTTAAAVAVCRAVEAVSGKKCGVKWVNDVYIDGRKVCGILTEAKVSCDMLDYCILGIGVNLTPPKDGFPEEIRERAGAVFDDIRGDADNRLAAAIVDEFMAIYSAGLSLSLYLSEYRERSVVIGKEIDVVRLADGSTRQAVAVAIDDECSLIVRYFDGTGDVLSTGDVTLRGKF